MADTMARPAGTVRYANGQKVRELDLSESDHIAVSFYDTAVDFPVDSFRQIAAKVLGPLGFAKANTTKEFERKCRKMFDLARDSHVE